jgi:hypothetical protein
MCRLFVSLLAILSCQSNAPPGAVAPSVRGDDVANHSTAKGAKMTKPMEADDERLKQVQVALRVVRLQPGVGDKYAWVHVRVVAVLKNESGKPLGTEMDIAYYSGKPGLPAEECTVYLEPYNDAPDHPWKLLGGSAARGVSHVSAATK